MGNTTPILRILTLLRCRPRAAQILVLRKPASLSASLEPPFVRACKRLGRKLRAGSILRPVYHTMYGNGNVKMLIPSFSRALSQESENLCLSVILPCGWAVICTFMNTAVVTHTIYNADITLCPTLPQKPPSLVLTAGAVAMICSH